MFAQSFELDGDLPWVFLEMFDESKQQDILWHRSQDWKRGLPLLSFSHYFCCYLQKLKHFLFVFGDGGKRGLLQWMQL